jgi:hypothetical protein
LREQTDTTAKGVVKFQNAGSSLLAVNVIGGTLTAKGAIMVKEAQTELLESLKAHIARLEAERDRASGPPQAVLNQRLEAAARVFAWLSTTLEPSSPSYSNAAALKRYG